MNTNNFTTFRTDPFLFLIPDEIGGGLVIYTPKGARIRTIIEDFWRQEHFANGYELLYTPHIGLSKLWEISGHLSDYQDVSICCDGPAQIVNPNTGLDSFDQARSKRALIASPGYHTCRSVFDQQLQSRFNFCQPIL